MVRSSTHLDFSCLCFVLDSVKHLSRFWFCMIFSDNSVRVRSILAFNSVIWRRITSFSRRIRTPCSRRTLPFKRLNSPSINAYSPPFPLGLENFPSFQRNCEGLHTSSQVKPVSRWILARSALSSLILPASKRVIDRDFQLPSVPSLLSIVSFESCKRSVLLELGFPTNK